ncbi:MAG TPA: RNA polymerase sigma factor [Terriglobia bacterium]|nr:RNA polymerase sigma factor [Terriglobia bacterium]
MSERSSSRMENALAQAVRGDAGAFESIVREHQGMVFSLAYHFLHDRALAEDMAQEVFLHLFRNLRSIQSPEHLMFWLRKVASHRCIDHLRGQQPQTNMDDLPEPAGPTREHDPLLEERLRRLVASLPERARLAVILRYQEELEYHEIAEVMEMPINTVKSNLQRALAVLRGKLARCMGDVPA